MVKGVFKSPRLFNVVALCLLSLFSVSVNAVTYDYSNRVQRSEIFAYDGTSTTQVPGSSTSPNVQLSNSEYGRIEAQDGSSHVRLTNSNGQYVQNRFEMQIDESETSVTQLTGYWYGRGVNNNNGKDDGVDLYIYNFNSGGYELLDSTGDSSASQALTGTKSSALTQYIDETNNNTVMLLAVSRDDRRGQTSYLYTDYVKLDVASLALPAVSTVGGSCGTDNLIVVQYASAASDEALKVSNYTLSTGNVTSVSRQDDSTVVLATDGLVGGQAYTLTVQGNNHTVSFDGLMGHYYDQRNSSGNKVSYPGGLFTGSEFLRLDSQVNFAWNTATPAVFPNISGNDERFSIRWKGYVAPSVAGSYEFRIYSDDGARLNLEGVEIVNDWSLHSPRYSSISAPQVLTAGQTYEVQMEHFEQTGRAYAQLEWRRDGGSWENIPTANLSTCPIPAVTPLPPSALEFRMDELSWNGTTDEVIDSSGNNDNGTARGGLNTVDPGHLCRAGDFDGVDDYIESNDLYDSLKGTSSMSFWIKTTQTGDDTGWRAPGIAGIEQSGGADDIFWGWLDASGRIGLSVANDFTTKSTIAINDDVYHHIVLTRDAASGAYKIYIDGNLNNSGTLATGVIGNSFSSIGRIEDTGGTPEYFEGDLDEVKVFGSVLTDTDVMALFNETRVCAPITGCAASFPDGISSHNGGTIDFGYQSQLFLSPDGILDAGNILKNGGSSLLTCDYIDCSASTASVPVLNPGPFPVFTSNKNISVNQNQTKTLGQQGGTDTYDNVTVAGTLNVSNNYTEYYIKNMNLQFAGVVNFNAGDYWIENLSVSSSTIINVVGGGTARLFVNNAISVGSSTRINSPSNNSSGSPEQLLVFGYSNVSFGSQTTTSAVVYANGNISLGSPSYVFGALTGSNINLSSNAQVSYDANAISIIDLGGACGGTSCSLGSFAITQPTYGLACPNARAPINIQALCVGGSTIKTDYAGTVDLSSDENLQSEFYLASAGGTAVSSVTLNSANSGEVDVYLFHKNENPDLKVTAEDAALSISTTASSGTDFRTSGFMVTNPGDFTCGNPSSFKVTAIGQDVSGGGGCNILTGFTGNKALKAWADVNIDPATPGVKNTGLPENITLNGSAVAVTKPASNNTSADFSAGVATVPVTYADVGEVININFVHDDDPYDGTKPDVSDPSQPGGPGLKGATGRFIVYPKEIQISTTSACGPPLKDCNRFAKADEAFSVSGKAVCSDGSTAKSYIGTVNLTHSVLAPSSGSNGVFTNGTLMIADNGDGEVTETDKKISEVGVFKITSDPDTYFGSNAISNFDLNDVGRFYPAWFDVSADSGSLSNSCSTYSYIGQPFGYTLEPSLTITAKSEDNRTTQNYTHVDFMKLKAADILRGFPVEDNATNGSDGVTLMAVTTVPLTGTLSASASAGVMDYVFDSDDRYTYTQDSNAAIAPFVSDLSIETTKIEDSDGVKASSLPTLMPTGIDIRYGRWVMKNAFGPETNDLSMFGQLEYLASSGYVLNTDDQCSVISAGDISSDPTGSSGAAQIQSIAVGGGTTDFSYDENLNGGVLTGEGSFNFSAPGVNNTGSVEIGFDLDSQPWLKHDWSGDGTVEDHPNVTATFGRYRGHDRIIYWREVSN